MKAYSKNTPALMTERLILRRFAAADAPALFTILKDEETTAFLPMFPLKTLADSQAYLKEHYLNRYLLPIGYRYAVCLKTDGVPIGFVNVGSGGSRDFGYAFKREVWHRGIATEAAKAVISQLQRDGVPYLTATHDVENPYSGEVMKKAGMTYRYSYEENWQPKNKKVIFRMYQLNLDGDGQRTYMGYWNQSGVRFVEPGL